MDLDEGTKAWLARRQAKSKREIRRRFRLQEEEGFQLFTTDEPAEIIKRLPAIQSLYKERQQARGGEGYRFDEGMVAAITETATTSSPGRLKLTTIEKEDLIIAMQLELRGGDRISAWMMGFDTKWSRLGPGKAVLAGAVDASTGSGCKIFDLGEGNEAYKADFADGEWPLESRTWCRARMARLLQSPDVGLH